MIAAPLIITASVTADLEALRERAIQHPVNIVALIKALAPDTDAGRAAKRVHMAHMGRQTVIIPGPFEFMVTFSIETHQPFGTARHMSMSIDRPGRVPNPIAVWMVAKTLGFVGADFEGCHLDKENLENRGVSINVIQPVNFTGQSGQA